MSAPNPRTEAVLEALLRMLPTGRANALPGSVIAHEIGIAERTLREVVGDTGDVLVEPLAEERSTRLVCQLGLQPVERLHVRRVGNDEVPACRCVVDVPLTELDGEAESSRVLTGERERGARDVHADHRRVGTLV